MAEERLALIELLEKVGEGDFLRTVAEAVVQLLMEADVEALIGASRYERNGERCTWRNGFRDRSLDTRLGQLQLRIPKLRRGSYFPPFLEARKSSEKALVTVIQEAWIGGVSTRRVDDLVQAMGLSGISKSQVSKLCKQIDERVNAFLDRPLTGDWPYLWLDATYLKQREGGRIVSVAAIIAVAVNAEGRREIVGLHIGPSEAETFWSTFLKSLSRRGLRGVKLVISDAHEGMKAAIRRVCSATIWMDGVLPHPGMLPRALSIASPQCSRCITGPLPDRAICKSLHRSVLCSAEASACSLSRPAFPGSPRASGRDFGRAWPGCEGAWLSSSHASERPCHAVDRKSRCEHGDILRADRRPKFCSLCLARHCRFARAFGSKHQLMRHFPAPNLQPALTRAQLPVGVDTGMLRLEPLE
jgi:hypothetical protein